MEIVSRSDGGVNKPSLRIFGNRCFQSANCSFDKSHGLMSSIVNVCRPNGGTTVGNGCVGHDCSPGMSVCGTGRSSIGQMGAPVTRLKTYRKPVLAAIATMSM